MQSASDRIGEIFIKRISKPILLFIATGNVINIVNSSNVHWGNVIHNNLSGGNSNKEQKYDDADMEVKKTKSIIQVLEADIKVNFKDCGMQ